MKGQHRRLLTPALVIGGCVVLLLVVIALATRSGSSDHSAALGFPIARRPGRGVGRRACSTSPSCARSDAKGVLRRRCEPAK
jgi:hypothetical protein